jgi:hypothetical protein
VSAEAFADGNLDLSMAKLFVAKAEPDPLKEAEAALKALREAPNKEAKKRAAEALDKALRKVKEKLK